MSAEQELAADSFLFQTVKERPEPIRAEIRGKIPSWLTGTLTRIGPGKFECGDISLNHLFDGQGLLHRFHIQDSKVTYSNRFVRSQSYADSLKHGSAIHEEFGTFVPPDPCQNIFQRLFSRFWAEEVPFDNTLVNVFIMKDKMYSTTETNHIFEIDPKTLETLKRVDITKEFPSGVTINSAPAHPHQTPDGTVINIGVAYGRYSTYSIIQIPPSSGNTGETPLEGGNVLCTISPTSATAYFHSFCITDNYVVITEAPLLLNVWQALSHKFLATSFEEWLYWNPNQQTRFHVVDRKDGNRLGVFTADPFFVFHHINAYEKDGNIYLDASCYRDNTIVKQLYLQNLRSALQPGQNKIDAANVRRYVLPLKELRSGDGEKPLQKDEDGLDYTLLYEGMELPRINYEEYNGKPYRFVYGVSSSGEQMIAEKLVKLNVDTKQFVEWEESGGFPSEPVFVKAPHGNAEDDGVVLSCVISDQTTSLLVLDAKEFKELGRAVVQGATPMTFHGIFQ